MDFNGYTKDLGTICQDMSSVFILDNSPAAYRGNPGVYVCMCVCTHYEGYISSASCFLVVVHTLW